MSSAELWLGKIIIFVMGFLQIIVTGIMLDYLLKFRPGLSDKFVRREEFNSQMELRKVEIKRIETSVSQVHNENREDHKMIFDEIKDMKKDMGKQFMDIMKELNKLNGAEKRGHA